MAGLLGDPNQLPALGNGINYDDQPEFINNFQQFINRPEVNTLRQNIEAAQRMYNGDIGPEVGQFLMQNNILRKPLQNGLSIEANWRNPYLGFKYSF